MTDQQIIDLLRANKTSKVFSRLYRYFSPVYKRIVSLGGTKNDALDVYQDALVIFCRKVQEENFVLTSSINTYLYSVCRFLWNDELRRRKRNDEVRWNESNDVIADTEWELLNGEDQRAKLAAEALNAIGKKCLELLQLFYIKGKSMKAIAGKMEFTSENAAKNQKFKCLEKAKIKLKELQQSNL